MCKVAVSENDLVDVGDVGCEDAVELDSSSIAKFQFIGLRKQPSIQAIVLERSDDGWRELSISVSVI